MIPKQNVKDMAWFFLADYHKMREEKDISGKELLHQKEPAHDDGGNLQPFRTVKYTKIRRFTVRTMCSREKAMGVVEQLFASLQDIKCMTHRSTQPSQQKPGIEIELSTRDLWRAVCNDVNLCDIHRRPTRLLRVIPAETLPS